MAARRIEPFPGTSLPRLPRHTTENVLETRRSDPADKQAVLSRSKLGDGFRLDGFDRRLEPTR
jgi:hypothetical protein